MISADTNIFVYALDGRDTVKQAIAQSVLGGMDGAGAIVGLQVIGELQNALRKRLRAPPWKAYEAARDLLARFPSFAFDAGAVEQALGEATVGRLSYWDALLLAGAEAAGVTVMISEDMGDRRVYRGLEIVSPFGDEGVSPRVRDLLSL